MAKAKYSIKNSHAAVIIWNYRDRMGFDSSHDPNGVDKVLISTVSCVSISTNKTKANPNGTFQFVLAPNKNWVSTITAGSWCTILMSNKPITQQDYIKADPEKVKMIGKIETVRVSAGVGDDGARRTQYLVSGVDWGYIFNNIIYVDNNIASANDPKTQGQGVAVAMQKTLFQDSGTPINYSVKSNLNSLIGIFGKPLFGFTDQGKDVNRLAKAVYDFLMPQEMVQYFDFIGPNGKRTNSQQLNKILTLFCGSLVDKDKYNNQSESEGFIDPFSLQGSHTFWQVLLENSNPCINEMLSEMRWEKNGLRLALYNRIRPFSFKGFGVAGTGKSPIRSYFQLLKTHEIDDIKIISLNAGTNWRDKYNFVEIKPQFQSFQVFANWYKQKSQFHDPVAFQREGFRPLIVETKQFPIGLSKQHGLVDYNSLADWTRLLKEWYFDTHRMLNGTITITGQGEYIAVGDNIQFDASLLAPNMSASQLKSKNKAYIMAHVESVSHNFAVHPEGAREYTTTIQFVRGIIVNKNGVLLGEGLLDKRSDDMSSADNTNQASIVTSSSHDTKTEKVK